METHYTLIDADALASLDNFKILDCRAAVGDPEHGIRAYQQGHIPGAQHLDLDTDLADPPGAGGRHPLPQPMRLTIRLQALGINDEDQVVVYDDAGGVFAARAWWCLRWLGHEAVAVLNGGMATWRGELATVSAPPARGNFSMRPSPTRTINADSLLSTLSSRHLIDARTTARFAGEEEPIDPVAGHIPGAVCLPFQGNLNEQGRFLPAAELRARFSAAHPDEDTVCYCGSGVTAAHNILAMKVAGYPEPALYPGSWSEWLLSPDRPIASHRQG